MIQRRLEDTLVAIAGFAMDIGPKPADETKCDYCELANSCRYEVAAMEQAKRAGI